MNYGNQHLFVSTDFIHTEKDSMSVMKFHLNNNFDDNVDGDDDGDDCDDYDVVDMLSSFDGIYQTLWLHLFVIDVVDVGNHYTTDNYNVDVHEIIVSMLDTDSWEEDTISWSNFDSSTSADSPQTPLHYCNYGSQDSDYSESKYM